MTPGIIPPQNLIRQVKTDSLVFRPIFYKPLIFDFFTIASSGFLGYAYSRYILGGASVTLVVLAASALSIISTLQLFLTKELGRRFFVIILQAIAILSFFYNYEAGLLAAAAAVIIFLPTIGEILGRRELSNGMEIKFFKAAKPLLAKWTTGIIVVFMLLYLPQWDKERVFIPQKFFESAFGWSSGITNVFYPNINLASSLEEFARGLAKAQLDRDQLFRDLPEFEQKSALEQAAVKISDNLIQSIDVDVKPEAPLVSVFYEFIIKTLRGWRERFGNAFLFAFGIGAFLIFRGFGTIFYWIIGFLSFIVYQIMLASNFMHIIGETRTREVIEL